MQSKQKFLHIIEYEKAISYTSHHLLTIQIGRVGDQCKVLPMLSLSIGRGSNTRIKKYLKSIMLCHGFKGHVFNDDTKKDSRKQVTMWHSSET